MKNSMIVVTSTLVCVISLQLTSGNVFASPPDGMYIGTTEQGQVFEVRVTDGRVDQWFLYLLSISCAGATHSGGIRTTIEPSCAIETDGTFVCGSTTCLPFSGSINQEIGGRFFTDNTVTGTIGLAIKYSGGCCYPVISYQAALFVEDVFADGFESGDCDEWSREVP